MKAKNIILLIIIGIISSLYINEKYQNHNERMQNHVLHEQINQQKQELTQQLGRCKEDNNSYKKFFEQYLTKKRSELNELNRKFTKEEKEWLEIYWEAHHENKENSFAQKQLIRAKSNLSKKTSEKELAEILSRRKEITELENRLVKFTDSRIPWYVKVKRVKK